MKRKVPRSMRKKKPAPKKPVLCYRIEIPVEICGKMVNHGPFTAAVYNRELEPLFMRYTRELRGDIKEPKDDGLDIGIGAGYVFGATSLEQLFQWMPHKSTWRLMQLAGYNVVMYDVPHTHLKLGGSQCAWRPEHASNPTIIPDPYEAYGYAKNLIS